MNRKTHIVSNKYHPGMSRKRPKNNTEPISVVEIRLKYLSKILYVVTALFAVVFSLLMNKGKNNDPMSIAIIASVLAFLSVLLGSLILAVLETITSLYPQRGIIFDLNDSFSSLLNYFFLGLLYLVIFTLVLYFARNLKQQCTDLFKYAASICFAIAVFTHMLNIKKHNANKIFLSQACRFFVTMSLACLFYDSAILI